MSSTASNKTSRRSRGQAVPFNAFRAWLKTLLEHHSSLRNLSIHLGRSYSYLYGYIHRNSPANLHRADAEALADLIQIPLRCIIDETIINDEELSKYRSEVQEFRERTDSSPETNTTSIMPEDLGDPTIVVISEQAEVYDFISDKKRVSTENLSVRAAFENIKHNIGNYFAVRIKDYSQSSPFPIGCTAIVSVTEPYSPGDICLLVSPDYSTIVKIVKFDDTGKAFFSTPWVDFDTVQGANKGEMLYKISRMFFT